MEGLKKLENITNCNNPRQQLWNWLVSSKSAVRALLKLFFRIQNKTVSKKSNQPINTWKEKSFFDSMALLVTEVAHPFFR